MGIGFWGPRREFVGLHAAVAPSLFPIVSLFWKEMENGAEGGGMGNNRGIGMGECGNGGMGMGMEMGERWNGDGGMGMGGKGMGIRMGEWGWE